MHPDLYLYIDAAWTSLFIVWTLGAITAKRTARSQSVSSRLIQVFLFVLAFLLLFNTLRFGPLAWRFGPRSVIVDYTGLLLTVVGIAFAIWARLHLGRNWSGNVTIKQDHRLIRTGPYAVLRHPIYAGFTLAVLGTAIAIGEVRGLAAAAMVVAGSGLKIRVEEKFMKEQFGVEYEHYKKHVKKMIPFVW